MKNNIRNIRRNLDMSQEELAKSVGMTRPAISNIETGKVVPSVENVLKIAKVLDVKMDELFYPKNVIHVKQKIIE